MNTFRQRLLSGAPLNGPLLRDKPSRDGERATDHESLENVTVPRAETRRSDHRSNDRHRLSGEQAVARWNGDDYPVELINLSGGGAMIAGDLHPQMWDRVDLTLGGCGILEAAVRWIRNDRIGLEFAHETRIEADDSSRDAILRDVLARSFPDADIAIASHHAEEVHPRPTADDCVDDSRRAELRHPMIWMGLVHYNHDSIPVRLRNISANGALIEGTYTLPVGAELMLDLGDAGSLFATVHWSHGDQSGLRFQTPFDMAALAHSKPHVAPARWNRPEYLREEDNDSSPWAAHWGRLSVSELRTQLEGYLKR